MSDNIQIEIYSKFLDQAKLKPADREKMKHKRGFTDETIDKFRFVSGGKQNRKIIMQLQEDYDDQILLKYGILEQVNDSVRPSSMLLDDGRIIIPYLNEDNKPTLLRPHKLGLKGVKIQPYCRLLLKDEPEHIILTEGEFKAVALAQWGVPGIAIPGISSFAGQHFDRLVDMLKEFNVKRVTIVYDNEIRNNPEFNSYKDKPEDRWDTPFWACVMQYQLKKDSIDAKISRLPDDWRENGKIDFDGALAQEREKNEIISIRDDRKGKEAFIKSLPREAQKIVRRKLAMYFDSSPIEREWNKYKIWKNNKGGESYQKTLSNFVINIKSSFFTNDGVMRHVQFVNEFGEKSRTFILEPEDMAGVGQFKKFCFSRGNYVWEGNGSDLQEVWKYELMRDTGDMIYMPEQIGEVEPNFWLFSNVAVKDGKIYKPDDDGIFWIDGTGYKPQSLSIAPDGKSMEDAIPELYLDLEDDEVSIKQIADKLKESVGGYHGYIGMGWAIASIFSRTIFNEFKSFPFIFPHGKRESGKSTFMRWLMKFYGIEDEGTSLAESTQNYIMRALSYFSSMGVWFDEYRNEKDVTVKDGYLRSAYNRQLSGKGVKSAFGARAYNVRGTLAISGEELPQDSGLYTRCIPLQMSANKRNRENYEWLNRMSEKFSGVTYEMIKNYNDYADDMIMNIRKLKAALVEEEITDRTAENWAILAGAFVTVVGFDQEFIDWILEACQEVRKTAEDEHILNVFWQDVVILFDNHDININHVGLYRSNGKKMIAMWYPKVYNEWSKDYRKRGNDPFDKASILQYIKDEPYFEDYKNVRLNGNQHKCYIMDPDLGTEELKELKEMLEEEESRIANR